MARGHQKEQSRQKNMKKQQAASKTKDLQGTDQRAAAAKALHYCCSVCKTQVPDPKTYKQHFENKHPKAPLPPECLEIEV